MSPAAEPTAEQPDHRANILLATLPPDELGRLAPDLEAVALPRPTELDRPNEEIDFVYFPTRGIASIVAIGEGGESVDTTMVGREGMTGLAVFLGTGQMPVRTMVQVPMAGFRLPSAALRGSSREAASSSPSSFATRRS